MFTGIIEEKGILKSVISGRQSGSIEIDAYKVLDGTHIGDSIAVNGVCLTVTKLKSHGFIADVMPETLKRTNLGQLRAGDELNLERAMAAGGRFGGKRTCRRSGNYSFVQTGRQCSVGKHKSNEPNFTYDSGERLNMHRRHQPYGGIC